jgi:hypothetical protein
MQRKVFLRHKTLGMIQKKSPALQAGLDHSSRLNVTLAGCSSAEPASVSVQLCKIQNSHLYLQPVKILSHLPNITFFTGELPCASSSLWRQ